MTIEGKLAVRGPGYEPFDFATTLGKGMAPGRTFRTLLPGEVAICVVVPASTRNKVLDLAGVTPRAWRSYVRRWEDDCMAHRCADLSRGAVTLFYYPHAVCPVPEACESLPPERKQRACSSGSCVPHKRKQRAAKRARKKRGMHQGTKRGMASSCPEALGGWRFLSQEGSSEIASRIERERDLGLADHNIAALLNVESIEPPPGFARWTGFAVRVVMGEAAYAA